jgi:hypothetical protein
MPERYHKAARASLDSSELLFLFTGDGRVATFYRGIRILVYRGAWWHLQPGDIDKGVRAIADRFAIDLTALERIFGLALRLSDEGSGALLTIGDH